MNDFRESVCVCVCVCETEIFEYLFKRNIHVQESKKMWLDDGPGCQWLGHPVPSICQVSCKLYLKIKQYNTTQISIAPLVASESEALKREDVMTQAGDGNRVKLFHIVFHYIIQSVTSTD